MGPHEDLLGWHGEPMRHELHGHVFYLPLYYHDSDSFSALCTADYDAVAEVLPSDAIRPLRWLDGTALVAVLAYRYRRVTWRGPEGSSGHLAPYGEVAVAILTTTAPAPRVLPLLRGRVTSFVLHLPVTTRESRDGGRRFFGLPKFLADMDFTEGPAVRSVRVSDQGRDVLTLTVPLSGPFKPRNVPAVGHVSVGGELREYVSPSRSYFQFRFGAGGAALELGTHPVADQLRVLGMSTKPVAVMNTLRASTILPPLGDRIGPAHDLPCYPGRDDDYARYTVTYPGSEPVDIYASEQHV